VGREIKPGSGVGLGLDSGVRVWGWGWALIWGGVLGLSLG